MVKNLPDNVGDTRDVCSIPGLARYPGEGNGNALQYSCPEDPMEREAWRATVHGVKKSDMTEATEYVYACVYAMRLFIYLPIC